MNQFTMLIVCAIGTFLTACTYDGGNDPLTRKVTWFSYLNGDDIRSVCGTDAPDRVRLVYNGIYVEQVRTYDIAASARDEPPVLHLRVIGPGNLSAISFGSVSGIIAPWTGRQETVVLPKNAMKDLRLSLEASGARATPPEGLRMESEDFYWIVNSCFDGNFAFNAFRWPSKRFQALTFPGLVQGWDISEISYNEPRAVDPRAVYRVSEDELKDQVRFSLSVGHDGLVGVRPLF